MAKRKIIIWSDTPEQCLGLRGELRETGDIAVLRDSTHLSGSFVEPANVLMFSNCARKDFIVSAYKAGEYRERYGECEFIDVVAGVFGEPVEVPALPVVPEPEREPDALDAQLAAMSDDELKENYTKIIGKKPHHMAKRETLEKELREAVN